MLKLIAVVVLMSTHPVAIDDNLQGSYAGIYVSISQSSFGRAFAALMANWWDNGTASFGGFPTPVPKTTPYSNADRNGYR